MAATAARKQPPARLQERYKKEIVPALAKKFGRENRLSLPKLSKIVLNMGVGKALQDKERMKQAAEHLGLIAGQTAADHQGPDGGQRLPPPRGQRDRLPRDAPRPADVRVPRPPDQRRPAPHPRLPRRQPKSFDGNGNYSMGLTEQLVFPEIDPDKVTFTQGMDITFVTTHHERRRGPRTAPPVRNAVPGGDQVVRSSSSRMQVEPRSSPQLCTLHSELCH